MGPAGLGRGRACRACPPTPRSPGPGKPYTPGLGQAPQKPPSLIAPCLGRKKNFRGLVEALHVGDFARACAHTCMCAACARLRAWAARVCPQPTLLATSESVALFRAREAWEEVHGRACAKERKKEPEKVSLWRISGFELRLGFCRGHGRMGGGVLRVAGCRIPFEKRCKNGSGCGRGSEVLMRITAIVVSDEE